MESITYKEHKHYLDFSMVQTTPTGNRFRYSGIRKDLTKAPVWRKKNGNNVECYHWIYTFLYIDKSGGFELLLDPYDRVSFG